MNTNNVDLVLFCLDLLFRAFIDFDIEEGRKKLFIYLNTTGYCSSLKNETILS